jgi:hypothetical protein
MPVAPERLSELRFVSPLSGSRLVMRVASERSSALRFVSSLSGSRLVMRVPPKRSSRFVKYLNGTRKIPGGSLSSSGLILLRCGHALISLSSLDPKRSTAIPPPDSACLKTAPSSRKAASDVRSCKLIQYGRARAARAIHPNSTTGATSGLVR